ncbi:MAG TPA: hypothetical protein VFS88_09015 [Micavibrio sp.]|nr:hypothetical protein [Micavibrio sp.]
MSTLAEIFEPIVAFADIDLNEIRIVAFDTDGTLVRVEKEGHRQVRCSADKNIAGLFRLLHDNKAELGLEEVVIISGHTAHAESLLEKAGLRPSIPDRVEDRTSFYNRVRGKNVLAVDDDAMLGMMAKACVNPKDERVQKYLNEASRRGLNIS